MPTIGIMDFVQRFQAMQIHRETGDELIKDLLVYCEATERGLRNENARLAKELEDSQLDLEDSKRSRRDMQQKLNLAVHQMTQSTADADSMRNRNPYIQVLIDGDGMIFNQNLVRLGIEGGKQAASTLRNAVLEQCSGITEEIEIKANVYANSQGLSNAMLRDGSLEDMEQLRNFMVGFSQGKASFDFIDIGHGKERADSKIKELMRWHLRNHNCKQILLGISHDAGYAPFLEEVVTQNDGGRVTIIQGPPTVRELASIRIPIIEFNKIFRNTKLVDRPSNGTSPAPPSTWAGVTSIPPPNNPSPIIAKNSIVKKPTPTPSAAKLAWVPFPRGLDPPIQVNATVLDKIKRRTTNNKLCNNHYLRGPCAKGDECCFEHNYKATDEDLKAIAYLTRLNPCLNGQDCDLEFCIYGHHCPSVSWAGKEPVCCQFGCRFGEESHPPNTTIKHPRKEGMFERY